MKIVIDPKALTKVKEIRLSYENQGFMMEMAADEGLITNTDSPLGLNESKMKEEQQLDNHRPELYEELKLIRKKIAAEAEVSPFIILHNRVLLEMSNRLPKNQQEMLLISGMGEVRLERYGKRFLEAIRLWCDKHD